MDFEAFFSNQLRSLDEQKLLADNQNKIGITIVLFISFFALIGFAICIGIGLKVL